MPSLNAVVAPTPDAVVRAQRDATQRAEDLATTIEGISSSSQVLVREVLPDADLASGADNGWNGTDREWVQAGLSADAVEEVYSIDSNNEAQNKVVVLYGLYNPSATVLTTEVIFQDGTGATFARFNVESLEVAEISDFILFDRPIVFGSTEDGSIHQWLDAAGDDQVVYLAKVAEPLGETLSTRERPESRVGTGAAGSA